MSRPTRVAVAATLAGAAVVAVALLASDGVRGAGFLLAHAPVLGIAVWWFVLAPLVLGAAALALPRTPCPWVGATTLHLAVQVATVTRLRHLADTGTWSLLGLSAVVGLLSIGLVAAPRPASLTRPEPTHERIR